MKAHQLRSPGPVDTSPLSLVEVPTPVPADDQLLIRVRTCGICHTDLHIVEGELPLPRLPLTPGHQIVGIIERAGSSVTAFHQGDRVGVPWLFHTCGVCPFCRSGRENLCDRGMFTGYHVDGGYAEFMVVGEKFAYRIPDAYSDIHAAPLLCAGVIGFRALRLSEMRPGGRLGIYGFGASAHIAMQIALHRGAEVMVFTRSKNHQKAAEQLGARWVGTAESAPPARLDAAVIFAPAGPLVKSALKVLEKGGTIALAGIHMSPIPELEYTLLYGERTVRSVANSTREDVADLLAAAEEAGVTTEVESFSFGEANLALQRLKNSGITASAALVVS
jgi:alcohol dehydrogenase, propanol-preferring